MKIKNIINNIEDYSTNIFVEFLVKLGLRLKAHNVTAISAQLSYYLFLSIFPFIIVFLNILSFTPLARIDVLSELIQYMPSDIQNIIIILVKETVESSNETLLSISAITGIWAASKGALAFMRVMNKSYVVEENRNFLLTRIMSIIITVTLFLSFILALGTLVFGKMIGNKLFSFFGLGRAFLVFWEYFRKLASLFFMTIIFALLYKFAPAKKNGRRIRIIEALPGSIFASIGWVLTSLGFAYYVNNFSNFAKTYGSLGGIIALLLWLYISSVIIILGGEINATLKNLKADKA